jgi:hypothetical protein
MAPESQDIPSFGYFSFTSSLSLQSRIQSPWEAGEISQKGRKSKERTNTLKISNVPMMHLQELQQVLAECGPIKMLDTHRLNER